MRLNKFFYTVPVELQSRILFALSGSKILVLKNIKNNILFYIKIPGNIFVSVKNENSFCFASSSSDSLNFFIRIFSKQVSTLRFPFYIKLFLKGLGFRIKLININNDRYLEFKLGFSHVILLKVTSKNILTSVKKNALIISGFLKTEVGNLANRIYNLRTPNVYTGKGFRYKRVFIKLKEVKKT